MPKDKLDIILSMLTAIEESKKADFSMTAGALDRSNQAISAMDSRVAQVNLAV